MKKIIPLLLICLMITTLASCEVSVERNSDSPGRTITTESVVDTASVVDTKSPSQNDKHPTDAQGDSTPSTTPENNGATVALAAYNSIASKMDAKPGETTEIEFVMNAEMVMDIAGQKMTAITSGTVAIKDMGGGKLAYSMYLTISELGTIEMVTNGVDVYCALNGMEIPIDMSEFDTQLDSSVKFPEFDVDEMLDSTTWNEGGTTYVSITIEGSKMNDLVEDQINSLLQQLGGDTSIKFEDIHILLTADGNDEPKSMRLDMSMTISASGEEVGVDMKYEYTITKFGSGVDIDFSKLG